MIDRRKILGAALALPLVPLPLIPGSALAQSPLTPSCGKQTAPQTAGPFFKPSSPERSSLVEKDARTTLLAVSGLVVSSACRPVAGALLDFWHADEFGEYDNKGFRYRGHLFSDAQGRWRLDTILPAEYPGRARHIHVNIQAPGKRILTTQLYFPSELGHHRDGLYNAALQMKIAGNEKQLDGRFDFVIDA
jgi:protocatechuate 3,4-dioxygenase beta subunit